MTTDLRQHLARLVVKKVDTYDIVVWEDPMGQYAAVAEAVCPKNAAFARWDRSWYRLRAELENQVAGPDVGRLLVYQPVATPGDDPFGRDSRRWLGAVPSALTAVKSALAGTLTSDRISAGPPEPHVP